MAKKQDIKKTARELIEKIKSYSRSQKEEWQKVPYLALEADGRGGYSGQLSAAYELGIWMIDYWYCHGDNPLAIDCTNGEIIRFYTCENELILSKASDKDILGLAYELGYDITQIETKKVIKDLKNQAKEKEGDPYHNGTHGKLSMEKWRTCLRENMELENGLYAKRPKKVLGKRKN